VPGYELYDESWPVLFNSYYEGEGERHARPRRGMLSRPTLGEVRDWRATVDEALQSALPDLPPETLKLVELGIQHEQQHQELFLTDILATFAENPLEPAYGAIEAGPTQAAEPLTWFEGHEGLVDVGAGQGFAFDSERPCHQALLHPHRIASHCVTNGEWQQFIADGGYSTPALWLSEGWDWIQAQQVERPL
jgi:ergothioneine biosynthesis protein EgtB